jgi:hypothetical protein
MRPNPRYEFRDGGSPTDPESHFGLVRAVPHLGQADGACRDQSDYHFR